MRNVWKHFVSKLKRRGSSATTPVLVMDFVNNTATYNRVVTTIANASGWSYTRSGAATSHSTTGVTSFATDTPRITDRGLLVEQARTNICLQSQTLDNASWTKTNCSISADAIVAPDGTTTADKVIENTSAGVVHRLEQTITNTNNPTTHSVYGKAGERNWLYIRSNDATPTANTAWFDLTNGVVGTVNSSMTATIEPVGNGWYRCSATLTSPPASANVWNIGIALGDGALTHTGHASGTWGLYMWGMQQETATSRSSYIPTTTTSVTRAIDAALMTSLSNIAYPCTVVVEYERAVDTGGSENLFCMDDNSSNNRVVVNVTSADLANYTVLSGGVSQAGATVSGALALRTTYKTAVRVATDDFISAKGGTLSTADTAGTLPSAPTHLRFGNINTGSTTAHNYIRKVTIYNKLFANADMQLLST